MSDHGCDACVHVDFDGIIDFHKEKEVTAHKEHKCGECNITIHPGDNYEYVSGKCDGHFFTAKTCLDCLSVRKTFFCEGWYYGQVWDDIDNHLLDVDGLVSWNCLRKLTNVARNKILESIEKIFNEIEEEESE